MARARVRPKASVKSYTAAVDQLVRKTAVRSADLDPRFYALLEELHRKGRAVEAVRSLAESLEGIDRDRIFNWRAYVYTLLRKFDEAAYQALKGEASIAAAPQKSQEGLENPAAELNTSAPEFVPGQYWGASFVGATPHAKGLMTAMPLMEPPLGILMPPMLMEPPLGMPGFLPSIAETPPPRLMSNGHLNDGSGSPKLSRRRAKKRGKQQSPQVPDSPSLCKLLNLDDDDEAAAVPAATPPPLPTGPLPSPGSAGHAQGTCKPCAFLHTKGCANGAACQFCHLCDPEEKKRRKREQRGQARP